MSKLRVRAVRAGSCEKGDLVYINVHEEFFLVKVGTNLGHRIHAGIWGLPWYVTVFKVVN